MNSLCVFNLFTLLIYQGDRGRDGPKGEKGNRGLLGPAGGGGEGSTVRYYSMQVIKQTKINMLQV